MFTAAEAVLRKLLARGARTHSIRFAFSVCATSQKKPCKFTGKFRQLKVQSTGLACIRAGGHGIAITEEAYQNKKEQKTTKRHGGKNDFCDSDRGILRGREHLKKRITWR